MTTSTVVVAPTEVPLVHVGSVAHAFGRRLWIYFEEEVTGTPLWTGDYRAASDVFFEPLENRFYVRVCTEAEWYRWASTHDREFPQARPWPIDFVRVEGDLPSGV